MTKLNDDMQALRDYVMAETGSQNPSESTVRLLVTHSNLKAKFMEIRLDMHVSFFLAFFDHLLDHPRPARVPEPLTPSLVCR